MACRPRLLCAMSISGSLVSAQSLQHADLQKDERFPLQSVMKLLVAVAVMDAVDRGDERCGHPHGVGSQADQSCSLHRGFSSGPSRSEQH
jgi:hypothetical protein